MLKTMEQFRLQYNDQAQYNEQFCSYAIPTKQGDQVIGVGCKDIVHQGSGTVRYG